MKKELDINILKEIVKEIAVKYNYVWECWNGGESNIDCVMIKDNIYRIRIKSFDSTNFSLIEEEINNKLLIFKYFICEMNEDRQNQKPIRNLYISNKKTFKAIRKINNKNIYKKCIINSQNCSMDNSKVTDFNTNINLNIK